MKKLVFALPILSLLILNSCTNDLAEITATNEPSITKVEAQQTIAPQGLTVTPNAQSIPNRYIIVYKESAKIDVDVESNKIKNEHGGNLEHTYKYALRGATISNINEKQVEAIKKNPNVLFVEQDAEVFANTTQSPTPSWGLDRVDQVSLPFSNTYTYTKDGTNVLAYVIDTGIKLDHKDFGGRAIKGIDVINGTFIDGNGHGTHVSGTIGGTTYGIAKKITLVAVRVLNNRGSGTISGVIAGVDWVTKNHTTQAAVANMSLGGGVSSALDAAVQNAISDGIVFCVAAGNSTADASTSSPARVPEAITVGATASNDVFAYYSNFGTLVDILAPGSSITSDWASSSTATNTISGTSMATPHVTGVAALYLAANPGKTPAEVQAALKTNASIGKISSVPPGTTNSLLFSNY